MTTDIAFLHTSPVHIATFDALLKDLAPRMRAHHLVAEALLADAQRCGPEDGALRARIEAAMWDAAGSGAAVVACTCSTIGGAAEAMATGGKFIASRIDRAMADWAVSTGQKVLVAAALESTLAPTTELVKSSAVRLGRSVEIHPLLIADAWQHFLAGDKRAYIQLIVAAVREAAAGFDVVVLAQASMAPAVDFLDGLGAAVLSSPRLGVLSAIDHVTKKRAA